MIPTSSRPGSRRVFAAWVFTLLVTAALPFRASAQTVQWIRQFGSSGANQARGVAVDSTGVYVVGSVPGSLSGQTNIGGMDAFIRKYDRNGNELWTRQFGSTRNDDAYGVAVDSTGVYVVGRTEGALPGQTNFGGFDAFVRKYDSSGNEVWTRQFGSGTRAGLSVYDSAQGVAANATGVYVAGAVSDSLSGQFSIGGFDAFVRKYDASGTEQWTRQFGSSSHDHAYGVAADSTGVYVVGDTGQTTTGFYDALVRKFDNDGNPQWLQLFGSPKQDVALGVGVDSTGVYVVGEAGAALPGQPSFGLEDAFVRKFDASGAELWTQQFGTAGTDRAFAVTSDGTGVYVAGQTTGAFPGQVSLGFDAFVRKYDVNGMEQGILQLSSEDDESARGAAIDSTGVYVGGEAGGTLGGQSKSGLVDAFVMKFSTTFPCTYAISPTNQFFGTSGGSGSFTVSTPINCSWTATSNASFVSLTGGNGTGTSLVTFSVAESTNSNGRVGTITVAGLTFTVTQDGTQGCTYTISPLSRSFSSNSETSTVSVTTPSACFWTATSSASFLTISTNTSTGSGNGTVEYTVAANPTALSRLATLTIGGQTFTVIQAGSAPVPPPPPVPTPSVNDGGVVNNASYSLGPVALAPGSIAAVFGSNLNNGSTVNSSSIGADGRLVTTLGGASVTINSIPAPLFYSTPGQLGVQIPFELAGQASATIQVTVGTQTSASRTIVLDTFAPGIFTVSRDGRGAAAALHQDGVTLITAQSPAQPGEIIVLYATGLGAVTPPLATGARSTGNQTVTTPIVAMDGIPGEILFSGAAPGFVGLNQVNVRVPASTRSSTAIPVVLSMAGKQSNSVTIAVAP